MMMAERQHIRSTRRRAKKHSRQRRTNAVQIEASDQLLVDLMTLHRLFFDAV